MRTRSPICAMPRRRSTVSRRSGTATPGWRWLDRVICQVHLWAARRWHAFSNPLAGTATAGGLHHSATSLSTGLWIWHVMGNRFFDKVPVRTQRSTSGPMKRSVHKPSDRPKNGCLCTHSLEDLAPSLESFVVTSVLRAGCFCFLIQPLFQARQVLCVRLTLALCMRKQVSAVGLYGVQSWRAPYL